MIKYPGQLDTNAELPPVADNSSEITAEVINGLREAIFAIERAIGRNPQGSAADLVSRLDAILNSDGTFKSAALVASGLIALPITNSMVSDSAAIEESKLDLDYTTQSLQNQISSNDIDISVLQSLYNTLTASLASHTSGSSLRHHADQIDIPGGIDGYAEYSTVDSAIDFLNNSLQTHVDPLSTDQHPASAISYIPDPDGPFTAINVQEAIREVDTAFQADRRRHNDEAHGNGIVSDGYTLYDGQVKSGIGALRISRFQPSTGSDRVKIGHINSAAAISRNFNPLGLSASASNIDFSVTSGTSTRTLSVTGLHTAAYPELNGRYPAKGVVDALNAAFANTSNAIPLQAFESDDGQIIIQHNIARSDCSFSIIEPGLNSAVSALGFSDIEGEVIPYTSGARAYINGYQIEDLREIITGEITLGISSSTIDLGEITGSGGLGLTAGQLLHIYSHTTSSAAGTYIISSVGANPSQEITLVTSIPAGTFSYVIYEDIVNLGTSSNPRCVDLEMDQDGYTYAVTRYDVSLSPISGISIVEVSPGLSGAALLTLTTGTPNAIQLTVDAVAGPTTYFDSGFIGEVDVYAADRIHYIRCLVKDTSLSSITSTATLTANTTADQRIKLGNTYYNGGLIIDIPYCTTPVNTIGVGQISQDLKQDLIGGLIGLSIGSGIIKGLSASAASSTTISLIGGSALLGGRVLEVPTQTISIFNKATATGTWNLVLDRNGSIDIYSNSLAGFSILDLVNSAKYTPLCQIVTSGGSITTVTDARIMVNEIGYKYLPTINQDSVYRGTYSSLAAASLHLSQSPSELVCTSDITISSATTIPANSQFKILGDLTSTATITLGASSSLIVNGDFTGTSVVMGENSRLYVLGDTDLDGTLTEGAGALAEFNSNITVTSIALSGAGASLVGHDGRSTLTLDGTDTPGIAISESDCTVSGFDITTPNASLVVVIDITGSNSNTTLQNLTLTRLGSTGSWSSGQTGIKIDSTSTTQFVKVTNCSFVNFETGIDIASTAVNTQDLHILDCNFSNCKKGIVAVRAKRMVVDRCIFSTGHTSYIDLGSLTSDCTISNNTFDQQQGASLADSAFKVSDLAGDLRLTSNTFTSITAAANKNIVAITQTGLFVRAINVLDNKFTGSTTSFVSAGYAIYFSTTNSRLYCNRNKIISHTGPLLSVAGRCMVVDNEFNSTSASGSLYTSISVDGILSHFINNRIITTTDQALISQSCNFLFNEISVGQIGFEPTSGGGTISGNTLTAGDTSTSATIYLAGTSTGLVISDNIITGGNVTAGISLTGATALNFCNNYCITGTSDYLLYILNISKSTISNNIFDQDGSTVASGVYITCENVAITNNTFTGSASSPSVSSIEVDGYTLADIYIDGNVLPTESTECRTINGSTQTTIGINKNAITKIAFSALSGAFYNGSGVLGQGWVIDTTDRYLKSSGTDSTALIPIPNLPVGTQIANIKVHGNEVLGDVRGWILIRTTASTSLSASTPVAIVAAGPGAFTMTITPDSTLIVEENTEYFVELTSNNTGNRIGTLVAEVYY